MGFKYQPLKEIHLQIQSFCVSFLGMNWPRSGGEHIEEIARNLRYGSPSKSDLLVAASIMSAYSHLTTTTKSRRERICSILQRVEKEAPKKMIRFSENTIAQTFKTVIKESECQQSTGRENTSTMIQKISDTDQEQNKSGED